MQAAPATQFGQIANGGKPACALAQTQLQCRTPRALNNASLFKNEKQMAGGQQAPLQETQPRARRPCAEPWMPECKRGRASPAIRNVQMWQQFPAARQETRMRAGIFWVRRLPEETLDPFPMLGWETRTGTEKINVNSEIQQHDKKAN